VAVVEHHYAVRAGQTPGYVVGKAGNPLDAGGFEISSQESRHGNDAVPRVAVAQVRFYRLGKILSGQALCRFPDHADGLVPVNAHPDQVGFIQVYH
jgi:hypothetical protein